MCNTSGAPNSSANRPPGWCFNWRGQDQQGSETHVTSPKLANDTSSAGAAAPAEVRRWRAFSLLAVAFLMTVIDLAIVNVALPTIGRKLHFPESDLQWVVTAYALTF